MTNLGLNSFPPKTVAHRLYISLPSPLQDDKSGRMVYWFRAFSLRSLLAREEDRRRCEKSSVERWVDMTDAGFSGERGGIESGCKSGVIGREIDGSI